MLLTREDIRRNLLASGLDLTHCWLTAGGALVFHGLRSVTADIDMGCDTSMADVLESAGHAVMRGEGGRRRFHLADSIDISENWAEGTVAVMDGIPVVSLEDVLTLKRQLGREKDQADIAAIEKALAKE
ncbi:MAG: hypothetical protein E7445_09125 [Ruminococcaceae bacterium]|nr:hypothetical protein [Oscillospiraceae bacterium]